MYRWRGTATGTPALWMALACISGAVAFAPSQGPGAGLRDPDSWFQRPRVVYRTHRAVALGLGGHCA